jgi:site-specific recombinase XerC
LPWKSQRRWSVAQAEELLKLGVRADDSRHALTKTDGEPVQPRSLTHVMSDFSERMERDVQKLRHSHASDMWAAKAHPKAVQEWLGHSFIAITMAIHSHPMPNMQS